jgi:signal recognition particle GTPase
MLPTKRNFNKHDWLEKRKNRKHMVNSLKNSKLLIGLMKNELIKILGDEYNDANSSR